MKTESVVRQLQPADYSAVVALLKTGSLSATDLSPPDMKCFLGVSEDASLAAIGCLQALGRVALLRSVATGPDYRGRGYAQRLVGELEATAKGKGVHKIYLLTETATTFFERLGYQSVSRNKAPESIAATDQFTGLCPDTACFMLKELND